MKAKASFDVPLFKQIQGDVRFCGIAFTFTFRMPYAGPYSNTRGYINARDYWGPRLHGVLICSMMAMTVIGGTLIIHLIHCKTCTVRCESGSGNVKHA